MVRDTLDDKQQGGSLERPTRLLWIVLQTCHTWLSMGEAFIASGR